MRQHADAQPLVRQRRDRDGARREALIVLELHAAVRLLEIAGLLAAVAIIGMAAAEDADAVGRAADEVTAVRGAGLLVAAATLDLGAGQTARALVDRDPLSGERALHALGLGRQRGADQGRQRERNRRSENEQQAADMDSNMDHGSPSQYRFINIDLSIEARNIT